MPIFLLLVDHYGIVIVNIDINLYNLRMILSSTIDDYKVHSYRTRAGPPPLNTELTPESITTNFIHRINRCVCVCVCVCVNE